MYAHAPPPHMHAHVLLQRSHSRIKNVGKHSALRPAHCPRSTPRAAHHLTPHSPPKWPPLLTIAGGNEGHCADQPAVPDLTLLGVRGCRTLVPGQGSMATLVQHAPPHQQGGVRVGAGGSGPRRVHAGGAPGCQGAVRGQANPLCHQPAAVLIVDLGGVLCTEPHSSKHTQTHNAACTVKRSGGKQLGTPEETTVTMYTTRVQQGRLFSATVVPKDAAPGKSGGPKSGS